MLADWIKLMAYSGARRNAALHARWEHVDWQHHQIHLFTKRNKEVVVDFNPKLETHLKDMVSRRLPTGPKGELSPFLFPTSRPGDKRLKGDGHMHNFQKTLVAVRTAVGLPNFKPHDLRHYFISICVMAGFDYLTIAQWAGHSDGGVLIGKVYGHLRPGHTQELAKRLTFEPNAAPSQRVADLSVEELLKLVRSSAPTILHHAENSIPPASSTAGSSGSR
jgi:integrase